MSSFVEIQSTDQTGLDILRIWMPAAQTIRIQFDQPVTLDSSQIRITNEKGASVACKTVVPVGNRTTWDCTLNGNRGDSGTFLTVVLSSTITVDSGCSLYTDRTYSVQVRDVLPTRRTHQTSKTWRLATSGDIATTAGYRDLTVHLEVATNDFIDLQGSPDSVTWVSIGKYYSTTNITIPPVPYLQGIWDRNSSIQVCGNIANRFSLTRHGRHV